MSTNEMVDAYVRNNIDALIENKLFCAFASTEINTKHSKQISIYNNMLMDIINFNSLLLISNSY